MDVLSDEAKSQDGQSFAIYRSIQSLSGKLSDPGNQLMRRLGKHKRTYISHEMPDVELITNIQIQLV